MEEQLPAFGAYMISFQLVFESAAATGSYRPVSSFLNGISINLYPIAGCLFHEPCIVTYMFVPSLSKILLIGALWAGNVRRGGVALPTQLESAKLELGVTTNWSPVFMPAPCRALASQAVKHVG